MFEAVLELLGDHGVDGVQYDAVARRAGVGRATVYRRWPQREDLVHDALVRFGELAVPVHRTADIHDDLTDFACSMATLATTPIGRALVHVTLHRGEGARIRQVGLQLLDERLPDLQARLDAAAVDGQIPAVDAAFLNLMIVGPVQLFAIRESRPFTRADAQRIVAVVLAGLTAAHAVDER